MPALDLEHSEVLESGDSWACAPGVRGRRPAHEDVGPGRGRGEPQHVPHVHPGGHIPIQSLPLAGRQAHGPATEGWGQPTRPRGGAAGRRPQDPQRPALGARGRRRQRRRPGDGPRGQAMEQVGAPREGAGQHPAAPEEARGGRRTPGPRGARPPGGHRRVLARGRVRARGGRQEGRRAAAPRDLQGQHGLLRDLPGVRRRQRLGRQRRRLGGAEEPRHVRQAHRHRRLEQQPPGGGAVQGRRCHAREGLVEWSRQGEEKVRGARPLNGRSGTAVCALGYVLL
mmetsp:Transcript_126445/g.369449  ORF Transcript_126445/g.369449 Transcript_126445/m.369449 type:complete len:283 (-) Transcript_126445:3-851(-)